MNTASSKVVLVTGASKGLGQAIAQRLVRNGHRVYGTSRKWNTGEKNGILTLGLDVTNEDSISKAVRAIIEAEGAIDVVINNAGIGIQGAIEDLSVADAHKALDTNLFGVHRVLKHVLPHMRSRKSGKIINISSIGANMGLPYRGFYSASKAALDRYSEALSIEMAPWGIQVRTIEPGDFKSDIAT